MHDQLDYTVVLAKLRERKDLNDGFQMNLIFVDWCVCFFNLSIVYAENTYQNETFSLFQNTEKAYDISNLPFHFAECICLSEPKK